MNAIEFTEVGKKYKKGSLLLKEAIMDMLKREQRQTFWALKDVTFALPKGKTLGIVGPNGSGKSTLLKLIAGVTVPTEGRVRVHGRVAPLIELGSGFHFELTGKENVFINATILGLNHNEIEARLDDILAFADIGDFINMPVKHYSSGMFMRLAFAVAIHVDPEVLLVDEILAVGDTAFQKKCYSKMDEFKQKGTTIILVSHVLSSVRSFCDQVMYLKNGEVQQIGPTTIVLDNYINSISTKI